MIDDWINEVFDSSRSEIGQRLGVPFVRAQAESVRVVIDINKSLMLSSSSSSSLSTSSSSSSSSSVIKNDIIEVDICQSSLGVLGISTVVWDAGLYLIDFLIHEQNVNENYNLGRVLDIGCGTGICGIIATYLKSDYVLLTDANISDIILENIEQIPSSLREKIKSLKYNWDNDDVPEMLISSSNDCYWDNIICSDVLYDSKYHAVLLRLISKLKFKRLILSYKRRHDEEEKKFFLSLAERHSIRLVNPSSIQLNNLNKESRSALHLFIITPM